jgi:hypothetical protein
MTCLTVPRTVPGHACVYAYMCERVCVSQSWVNSSVGLHDVHLGAQVYPCIHTTGSECTSP